MGATISVIIPVFNAKEYLARCLSSVSGQTYRALEIILVDDGSTDGSGALCDAHAAGDDRVRVIHQENMGPSAARNRGLEEASGEWIAFVDSDDYPEPDLLEFLLRTAEQADADMVQCGTIEEGCGKSRVLNCPKEDIVLENGADGFAPEHWRILANSNWGKLYRRSRIGNVRFDLLCRVGEDLQFNLRFLMGADRIVLSSRAKYHYVLTEGSLFRGTQSRKTLLHCRQMLDRMEKEPDISAAVRKRVEDERYRNGLDICSRIVCFGLKQETAVLETVRREIRNQIRALLRDRAFSGREKVKFVLIAYFWPVYCVLLRQSKRA